MLPVGPAPQPPHQARTAAVALGACRPPPLHRHLHAACSASCCLPLLQASRRRHCSSAWQMPGVPVADELLPAASSCLLPTPHVHRPSPSAILLAGAARGGLALCRRLAPTALEPQEVIEDAQRAGRHSTHPPPFSGLRCGSHRRPSPPSDPPPLTLPLSSAISYSIPLSRPSCLLSALWRSPPLSLPPFPHAAPFIRCPARQPARHTPFFHAPPPACARAPSLTGPPT